MPEEDGSIWGSIESDPEFQALEPIQKMEVSRGMSRRIYEEAVTQNGGPLSDADQQIFAERVRLHEKSVNQSHFPGPFESMPSQAMGSAERLKSNFDLGLARDAVSNSDNLTSLADEAESTMNENLAKTDAGFFEKTKDFWVDAVFGRADPEGVAELRAAAEESDEAAAMLTKVALKGVERVNARTPSRAIMDFNLSGSVGEFYRDSDNKIADTAELSAGLFTESLANMVVVGASGAGGTLSGGPVGGAAAVFATGSELEYSNTFAGELVSELQDRNDFSSEAMIELMRDKDFMDRVDEKARKRGLIIGGVDGLATAVGAGVASKLAVKAGSKAKGVAAAVGASTMVATPLDAIGGSTGEFLAQLATGDDPTSDEGFKEVFAEGMAEMAPGSTTALTAGIQASFAPQATEENRGKREVEIKEKIDQSTVDQVRTMVEETVPFDEDHQQFIFTDKEGNVKTGHVVEDESALVGDDMAVMNTGDTVARGQLKAVDLHSSEFQESEVEGPVTEGVVESSPNPMVRHMTEEDAIEVINRKKQFGVVFSDESLQAEHGDSALEAAELIIKDTGDPQMIEEHLGRDVLDELGESGDLFGDFTTNAKMDPWDSVYANFGNTEAVFADQIAETQEAESQAAEDVAVEKKVGVAPVLEEGETKAEFKARVSEFKAKKTTYLNKRKSALDAGRAKAEKANPSIKRSQFAPPTNEEVTEQSAKFAPQKPSSKSPVVRAVRKAGKQLVNVTKVDPEMSQPSGKPYEVSMDVESIVELGTTQSDQHAGSAEVRAAIQENGRIDSPIVIGINESGNPTVISGMETISAMNAMGLGGQVPVVIDPSAATEGAINAIKMVEMTGMDLTRAKSSLAKILSESGSEPAGDFKESDSVLTEGDIINRSREERIAESKAGRPAPPTDAASKRVMSVVEDMDTTVSAIRRGTVINKGFSSSKFATTALKIFGDPMGVLGGSSKQHLLFKGLREQMDLAAKRAVNEFNKALRQSYKSKQDRANMRAVAHSVLQDSSKIDAVKNTVVREKIKGLRQLLDYIVWLNEGVNPQFTDSFRSIEDWMARRYEAFDPNAPNRYTSLKEEALKGNREAARVFSNAFTWVKTMKPEKDSNSAGTWNKREEGQVLSDQEALIALRDMVSPSAGKNNILKDITSNIDQSFSIEAGTKSFKGRQVIPQAIREYLGEIRDPASSFLTSSTFHSAFIGHTKGQQATRDLLISNGFLSTKQTLDVNGDESKGNSVNLTKLLAGRKGMSGLLRWNQSIGEDGNPDGNYQPETFYTTQEGAIVIEQLAEHMDRDPTLVDFAWSGYASAIGLLKAGKVIGPAGIPINVSGALNMLAINGIGPWQFFNIKNPAVMAALGTDNAEVNGVDMDNVYRIIARSGSSTGNPVIKDISASGSSVDSGPSSPTASLNTKSNQAAEALDNRFDVSQKTPKFLGKKAIEKSSEIDENLGLNEGREIVVAFMDVFAKRPNLKTAPGFREWAGDMKKLALVGGGVVIKKADDVGRLLSLFDIYNAHRDAAQFALDNGIAWAAGDRILTEMPSMDELAEVAGEEVSRTFTNYDRIPKWFRTASQTGLINYFSSFMWDLARSSMSASLQMTSHINAGVKAGKETGNYNNPYMKKGIRMLAGQVATFGASMMIGSWLTAAFLGTAAVTTPLAGGDDETAEGKISPSIPTNAKTRGWSDTHKRAFERSVVPTFHTSMDTYIINITGKEISYGVTDYVMPHAKIAAIMSSGLKAEEAGRNPAGAIAGQVTKEIFGLDFFDSRDQSNAAAGMINDYMIEFATNLDEFGGQISNAPSPLERRWDITTRNFKKLGKPSWIDQIQKGAFNVNRGAEITGERKMGEGLSEEGLAAYRMRFFSPVRSITMKLDGKMVRGKIRSFGERYTNAMGDAKRAKEAGDTKLYEKEIENAEFFKEDYTHFINDLKLITEVTGLTMGDIKRMEKEASTPTPLKLFKSTKKGDGFNLPQLKF